MQSFPACVTCKHHILLNTCPAFGVEGIPADILTGENDHLAAVAGDHGIRYEPVILERRDGEPPAAPVR